MIKLPTRYERSTTTFSSGGMSDAVICRDNHLDRDVVVKALKPGTDPRRILDELAALQAIRSKHVVQIYDVIRSPAGAVIGIVEECLPGKDLQEVLPPTTPEEFYKLIYPIAEGIADIHAHNRVHRDIKRQNMKFDAEGCLKIFDFGLARDVPAGASTKGSIGTPGYMAPELFEASVGGSVRFDFAIDTYAFAATALAVARGKLPKKLRGMPPDLPCSEADFTTLSLNLPAEVANALNSCLNVTPSSRPAMADMAKLIGLYLLRDRHRALLISQGKPYVIDSTRRVVRLSVTGRGSVDVAYDGLRFKVAAVSGDVSINNTPVNVGTILPGSCVIILGSPELGTRRTMITVDVSHPDVTI